MKYKIYLLSLEELWEREMGDVINSDYWTKRLGLYIEPDQERKAEIGLLRQMVASGFFPPKEALAITKTLDGATLASRAEEKAKERGIVRCRNHWAWRN